MLPTSVVCTDSCAYDGCPSIIVCLSLLRTDIGSQLQFLVHLLGSPCLIPVLSSEAFSSSPCASASAVRGEHALEAREWKRRLSLMLGVFNRVFDSISGTTELQDIVVQQQEFFVPKKTTNIQAGGESGTKVKVRSLVISEGLSPRESSLIRKSPHSGVREHAGISVQDREEPSGFSQRVCVWSSVRCCVTRIISFTVSFLA